MDLTKYPVSEVMQSMEQRLESLRRFYPEAKAEDWRLEVAGQRVQIIKKDPKKGGVLQFGTELVAAKAAGEWASKLKEIVLACEKALETDAALYRKINSENDVSLERVERSSEAAKQRSRKLLSWRTRRFLLHLLPIICKTDRLSRLH